MSCEIPHVPLSCSDLRAMVVVNNLKCEHLTRIMSTERNVPGQTAPHLGH
jgi:hypothetical protein